MAPQKGKRKVSVPAPSQKKEVRKVFTPKGVYFKTESSPPAGFLCTSDGRINFSALGKRFKLDPASILLNGWQVASAGVKSEATWGNIREFFQGTGRPVGTQEDPVIVTGDPPVHGASTEEETCAKGPRIFGSLQIGKAIQMNFRSDDCDIRKWKSGTLVSTAGMNEVMKSFGGFPTRYYVRQEEINVFKTVWSRWEKGYLAGESLLAKSAIVGSPGVGKSAFIVLLAFYMARLKSRNVLLLRRLKKGAVTDLTCVFLCEDSYYGVPVRNLDEFGDAHWWLRERYPDLLFFVDGFTHTQVDRDHFLSAYGMLATSSQFRWKSGDPTALVVLPAWQFCDLEDFARKTKMFEAAGDVEDLSRTKYYYSGGSLWEFCRDLPELKDRLGDSLRGVGGTAQAVTLIGEHGGVSETQVDGLRRRYLNDRMALEQYRWTASKFVVDSGYVLRSLLLQCDKEQYEKVYNFAKAFGEAFHEWAFELYLHKLAISGGFTIQAKKYGSADPRERYEIKCSEPTWAGINESECKTSLRSWASNGKSKYWYPQYSRFPNIDGVAKAVCTTTGETVIAYIQITIAETHELNGAWMDELDKIFQVPFKERIYIAIQPKKVGSDQNFKLTGSRLPKQVPVYEAYFEGCVLD